MMRIVICPGFHSPLVTESFLTHLQNQPETPRCEWLVVPSDRYPPFSGWHILQFLQTQLRNDDPALWLKTPIAIIGFSAGVVGAIGAASAWTLAGGNVQTLIAVDGWGVPLGGNFPIHRLSHDYLTHWTSALLGAGLDSFYADPGVGHLDLWRSPHTTTGWRISPTARELPIRTTAAHFVAALLGSYNAEIDS
jgi:hypothetical protein